MTDGGRDMPGSFRTTPFDEVDLSDPFFDSLREDYPGFDEWFTRKAAAGESALVHTDEQGLGAFVYLKTEDEAVDLVDESLPQAVRLKIGTLKVADRVQGERLGEGAIGLALWAWRDSGCDQVYVTVFEKHQALVGMLRKFGFTLAGTKDNGESVYVKDRAALNYGDAYLSFPFVDPEFEAANLLVVEDGFHDELFPYSELANELQETFTSAAANGVTKVYIGGARDVATGPGHPILVYRKYTGDAGSPGYKSVVTSYGVVTDVVFVKKWGRELVTYEEFRARVKNKSVFTDERIEAWYRDNENLVLIELVYLGYFGPGHNVNWMWMKDNGYWGDTYPHQFSYSREQLAGILEAGDVDVATRIVIYSTAPVGLVVGEAEVLGTLGGSPEEVWKVTSAEAGISKEFYDSYFKGRSRAVAYELGKITKYRRPKLLRDVGVTSAPQSFVYLPA